LNDHVPDHRQVQSTYVFCVGLLLPDIADMYVLVILILASEIFVGYCEKHSNIFCGQNEDFFNAKPGGTIVFRQIFSSNVDVVKCNGLITAETIRRKQTHSEASTFIESARREEFASVRGAAPSELLAEEHYIMHTSYNSWYNSRRKLTAMIMIATSDMKVHPVTGRGGLRGCGTLTFPYCLDRPRLGCQP
jgi:hypothetical protein